MVHTLGQPWSGAMRWIVVLLLFLVACKRGDGANVQTDPLNLTGDTGRNLILEVSGVQAGRSKSKSQSVCAIGVAGDESVKKEMNSKRLVCTKEVSAAGEAFIKLTNLPYPAYIMIFHDENLNNLLDFATFNIIVARKDGPIEGVGKILDPNDEYKFSRPIWVEVGESKQKAKMNYDVSPFWKFVSDQSWQYLYGKFLEQAQKINHPSRPKNPFCTKIEECL